MTPRTESLELEFYNHNRVGMGLDFIESTSAQRLLDAIRKIRQPLKIVAIYAVGDTHIAWIQTTAKIKKGSKNGSS